jgi:hypothetical protein
MIQAPLQSQMPITQKTLKFASYKVLHLILVGFTYQKKTNNHWVVDTITQVKDSPTSKLEN